MKKDKTPNTTAAADTARQLESDLSNIGAWRASALADLKQLREMKATHDQREYEQLTKMLPATDPRLAALASNVTNQRRFLTALTAEISRAEISIPTASKGSWSVYGFVTDANAKPQSNLTIALVDRSGRWMEALGHACTDQNGYYEHTYTLATDSSPSAAASSAEETILFIQVSNQRQQVLMRDATPVVIQLGEVEHRDIELDATTSACQPPPAEVRADFHEPVKPERAAQPKQTRSGKKKR